jgi:hypothetical protein
MLQALLAKSPANKAASHCQFGWLVIVDRRSLGSRLGTQCLAERNYCFIYSLLDCFLVAVQLRCCTCNGQDCSWLRSTLADLQHML